jgi:ABC-type sulfate transport system substrate-binding protein
LLFLLPAKSLIINSVTDVSPFLDLCINPAFLASLGGARTGQKMGAMQNRAWVSKQIAQPEWFI